MEFPYIVPELKDFILKLLGPPSEELGLLLGEQVKLLRLKSSIKVFQRAKQRLIEAGFSEPKPIDLKTLVPLLEYCSLENEDNDLIEKWAGLLSSACIGSFKCYCYPQILNQLSPIEAQILDMMYGFIKANIPSAKWWHPSGIGDIWLSFNISKEDYTIYIVNLNRLGLIEITNRYYTRDGGFLDDKDRLVSITPLGADFIEACRGPSK